MSIKAFPLNQQEYSYNAQDVMKYYAGRNSGVFETGENLKVSANGGLEIRVNSGMGWLSRDYVASVAFWNESVEYLMVDAGHDTYDRIDLVVVSWNFVQQEQNPKLIIRKGTPSSSPAVPSLVNDSSTIEIALAKVIVPKGAITLSDSNIVDLRGNDTYCPMVYDEQTIRNAFVNCVGFADGVKKISDFPSVTPASSDKILIEQRGEGKSTPLESLPIPTSVQNKLDTKVDYTDLLTYEQIMATTPLFDLDKTAPKASAFKSHAKVFTSSIAIPYSDNNISLIRAGNVVQCSHYSDTTSSIPDGGITFGNIPDGYKPITITATESTPNGNNILIYTYINTLRGYNYRGSEYFGSFRFSMTWITNDPFPTT